MVTGSSLVTQSDIALVIRNFRPELCIAMGIPIRLENEMYIDLTVADKQVRNWIGSHAKCTHWRQLSEMIECDFTAAHQEHAQRIQDELNLPNRNLTK